MGRSPHPRPLSPEGRGRKNLNAVIWDVDGTLVDTAELHFYAWATLTRLLQAPFTRAYFNATFGQRNADIVPGILGTAHPDGTPYTAEEIEAVGEAKEALYRGAARRQGVKLLPGAHALLGGLQSAGFKQAIGSSAPRENLELILKLTETTHFFDAVVSMEDTERGKPDPQVFQVAAERLRMSPPRCVVMEDAVAGVQAAKAAGMKCVAIRFAGHHDESALTQAGANLVVRSLEEVSVERIRGLL